MAEDVRRVYTIRHGQTEWSLSGRHTGVTDLPLTEHGRETARQLQAVLKKEHFALVLTSPLQRARETCALSGLGDVAEIDRDLMEWNYGAYEGLTTREIREKTPDWMIFTDGCPGGEAPEQVGARVDRIIARVRAVQGNVALFAHGHLLRVLAARWLELAVAAGRHFFLDTGTLSVLSHYDGVPAIRRWNTTVVLDGPVVERPACPGGATDPAA